MLKHAIRWIVPLVVLAVLAVGLVVGVARSTHAATILNPVAGPSGTTPTPSGSTPDVSWGW